MRRFVLVFAASALMGAQPPRGLDTLVQEIDLGQLLGSAVAPEAPDRVVAEVDGRKITAGELHRFFISLPPQMKEKYAQDRKDFVLRYALIRKFADMAVADKLDQKFPFKEQLEIARMNILMEAKLSDYVQTAQIGEEQIDRELKQNGNEYRLLRLKGIHIFKNRPEDQARAKSLAAQWRAGEDIAKAVMKAREETAGGLNLLEAGWHDRRSNLPESVRKAVFAAKVGEITGPFVIDNQIWIFRIEEERPQTPDAIREAIREQLQQRALIDWIEATRKGLSLKIQDPEYFGAPRP
jgi:parvulin-like peptidyl-prolyl isomerase